MPNNNTQVIGTALSYVSNFYQSFSGTDTLVFIMMPGSSPVVLGSITTISYSLYRTKQPVINLGRTNINGVTRGARIFAGSMIFTMINQHWLKELQDSAELSWLGDYNQLKADELPLFDLMIVSANEYGSYVSMFLYGVDVTDEGQVVSVNDLFTENTCSFIARDIETFTAGRSNRAYTDVKIKLNNYIISNIKTRGWDFIKEDFLFAVNNDSKKEWDFSKIKFNLDDGPEKEQILPTIKEPAILEKTYVLKHQDQQEAVRIQSILTGFTQPLEYREFNVLVSDIVGKVQLALKELDIIDFVNNLYDLATYRGVKKYQSTHGFEVNGIVDYKVFTALMTDADMTDGKIIGSIINKSGSRVYLYPDDLNANIVAILNYGDNIVITDKIQNTNGNFYKIEQGYVKEIDVYSYYYTPNVKEFPTINLYETGYNVLVLQQLLESKYEFDYQPGIYDNETQKIVTKIQAENNINCTLGIVNDETWRVIESLTGNIITDITENNVNVISKNAQGNYNVTSNSLDTELMKGFDVTIISPMTIPVKTTCVGYYPNGKTSILTKGYTLNPNQAMQIPFTEFSEIFTYSIEHKNIPEKIEYIIYPSNGNAFKWVINYSI